MALSVPEESTCVTGNPAHRGNCSVTSRETSAASMSSSSA